MISMKYNTYFEGFAVNHVTCKVSIRWNGNTEEETGRKTMPCVLFVQDLSHCSHWLNLGVLLAALALIPCCRKYHHCLEKLSKATPA